MIYRHLHRCLSRYILTQVFTEYDLLRLFLSWVPSPQRISVLLPTLVLDALHILKEYRMPDDYPILPFFFPSEDKSIVSILCLYFHSWTSSRLTVVSPGLVYDPWNGKTQLSLLCNQGWSKNPSWSGTFQSSLLTRDSPFHQQFFFVGPSVAWSISFLDVMKFSRASSL